MGGAASTVGPQNLRGPALQGGTIYRNHDRGQEDQPGFADLAEAVSELHGLGVDILRQPPDPRLLAVGAAEREIAAVDLDDDLTHPRPPPQLSSSSFANLASAASSRPAIAAVASVTRCSAVACRPGSAAASSRATARSSRAIASSSSLMPTA